MTAYTSTQTGLFSANSTWGGGGHPSVDGDTFTVASGHVVTFDMDTSGLANGFGASVVTGELHVKTDGTVTYLKMNGNLSGAGKLYIGNSAGDPIPAPAGATPEVATLAFNNATGCSITGTLECHGEIRAPAVAITSKTDNTHIVVAAGGPTFRAGDVICVSDSTIQTAHSPVTESFTVSAYNAGTREITLGSALSRSVNQNSVTDYVLLISRCIVVKNLNNIAGMISGTSVTVLCVGARFISGAAGGVVVTANSGGTGPGATQSVEFDNCSFEGLSATIVPCNASRRATFVNCAAVNLTSSGWSSYFIPILNGCYAVNSVCGGIGAQSASTKDAALVNCVALNCSSAGLLALATVGAYLSGCIAYNCASGASQSNGTIQQGCIYTDCIFGNNTTDAASVSGATFYNCLFASATEFSISASFSAPYARAESFDHDQVIGSYKAQTPGGNVTSVASPVYDATRVRSYQHACTSAVFAIFKGLAILVPPGGSVYVRCYVQKSVTMTYLPRLWVFAASKEPFVTGSPDAEAIMTDSLNTWEVLEVTVTNSTNSAKPYIVRTVAKNGSGNVFFDPIIRVSGMLFPAALEGGLIAA